MIKLSVIIPLYNCEKHIERCIQKILIEQIDNISIKNNDIEIIIINDGSTDRSQQIVEDFLQSYNNIILINKKNEGVSAARNVGIKAASGKYICFIDADDYLDKASLPKLVKISTETNSDVITFQYRTINEHQKLDIIIDKYVQYDTPIDGRTFIKKTKGLTWRHGCWINIYRHDFIKKNEIYFPENIHWNEDCIFVWKVFSHAKNVVVINNIFYNYIQHQNSCMHNKSYEHLTKLLNCTIPIIQEFDKIKSLHNDEEILSHLRRNIAHMIYGHINSLIKLKYPYQYIKQVICTFKSLNLYPILNFTIYPGYNRLSYKLKRIVFNNSILRYIYIILLRLTQKIHEV